MTDKAKYRVQNNNWVGGGFSVEENTESGWEVVLLTPSLAEAVYFAKYDSRRRPVMILFDGDGNEVCDE